MEFNGGVLIQYFIINSSHIFLYFSTGGPRVVIMPRKQYEFQKTETYPFEWRRYPRSRYPAYAKNLSVMSWNVGGWKTGKQERESLHVKALRMMRSDVIFLSETHLLGWQRIHLKGYAWFGANRSHSKHKSPRVQHSGGIGFFIRKSLLDAATHIHTYRQDSTVMLLQIVFGDYLVNLIGCYLPPYGSIYHDAGRIRKIQRCLHETEPMMSNLTVICGDFNIRVGEMEDVVVDNNYDIPKRSEAVKCLDRCTGHAAKGRRFLREFLNYNEFYIANGRHGDGDDYTCFQYRYPNGITTLRSKSVLDYIILPQSHYNRVETLDVITPKQMREMQSAGIECSDHSILKVVVKFEDIAPKFTPRSIVGRRNKGY